MGKVVIVSDSTIDLSKEDYARYDLHILPLIVNFEGRSFQDGIDISGDEIYAFVKKTGELPSTAAVGPGRLVEFFSPFIAEGDDIVFVGIGAKLSGTVQAALIAAQEFPVGRIYIVDSKNLSSGSGLLAIRAASLRDKGQSAKQIAEDLTEAAKRLSVQFVLERLDYIHKGGRCSGAAALVGNLFHIHPIAKVIDGKLLIYKKPRGRIETAYDEMLEIFRDDFKKVGVEQNQIMVTHAGCDQSAIDYLVEKLGKIVDPAIIRVTRAGAVISSHCGYGTIGILYIKQK